MCCVLPAVGHRSYEEADSLIEVGQRSSLGPECTCGMVRRSIRAFIKRWVQKKFQITRNETGQVVP